MANVFNKVERMVRTALALLERDAVVANLIWRDAAGDFRGAKGDTISIRLPAYAKANKRALRSGAARTVSTLHERKVDVTLDTDLYLRIKVTDEELTLDIEDFERQVILPATGALVRGIEDEVITLIQDATYQNTVVLDPDSPYTAAVRARKALNDSRVPADGRAMIVGSEIEAIFLEDEQFVRADASGSTQTLREAQIGRVAGFNVFTVPGLEPDVAFAFHRTAYVLNSRAPSVPASAGKAGRTIAQDGFALRIVQILESDSVVDNVHADVWTGTNIVKDFGKVTNGRFEPGIDPENPGAGETEKFVRSVAITLGS